MMIRLVDQHSHALKTDGALYYYLLQLHEDIRGRYYLENEDDVSTVTRVRYLMS